MHVYHVGDELPKTGRRTGIFLAGPTPRSDDVQSWRPEALSILEELGYDGAVYVPETATWGWLGVYDGPDGQVHWEWRALALSKAALFWVPRNLEDMPAFTTNVEFGLLMGVRPSSVVLGAPKNAPKVRYLKTMVEDVQDLHRYFDGAPNYVGVDPKPVWGDSLRACLQHAIEKANDRRYD